MTYAESKPDLALIHGWGLGSSVWQALLPALKLRFHVHLISLPGYDLPEDPLNERPSDDHNQKAHEQRAFKHSLCRTPYSGASSAPSFDETAKILAETLPEGCIVCGWSLGGMLALKAAALAPQRFKRLILVGSTPSFTQRDDWVHAQAPALLDTFSDAIAKDAAGTLQRFIALLNQGDAQARLLGRTMIRQLLATRLPDTATLLTGLGWLRDVDLRPTVAAIAVPTLLIHGENDRLMPLPAAWWLNDTLPEAQFEIVTGVAHAPFLNDPEGFAKRIGDYCHAPALH